MKIACLQHVEFERPARLTTWAEEAGATTKTIKVFAGESLTNTDDFDLLVVLGGPMSVGDVSRYPWLDIEKRLIGAAIAAGKRVVGICLGAQLVAEALGASVYRNPQPEIGWFPVRRDQAMDRSTLGVLFPPEFIAFHWHGDTFDLPQGSIPIGSTEACEQQGFVYRDSVVGLQFHLEMDVTGVTNLLEHCADELVEAPFVQTSDTILSNPRQFAESNALMFSLMDRLTGRQTNNWSD